MQYKYWSKKTRENCLGGISKFEPHTPTKQGTGSMAIDRGLVAGKRRWDLWLEVVNTGLGATFDLHGSVVANPLVTVVGTNRLDFATYKGGNGMTYALRNYTNSQDVAFGLQDGVALQRVFLIDVDPTTTRVTLQIRLTDSPSGGVPDSIVYGVVDYQLRL